MKTREIIRKWLEYLKPNRSSAILGFFLLLFSSAIAIITPLFIKGIIDEGIMGRSPSKLYTYGLLFLVLHMINFIVSYFNSVILETMGQNIMINLKRDTYGSILKKHINFFGENPEGKLISKVESDGESIRQLFTANTVSLLSNILVLAGMVIIMLRLNARLFLITVGFVLPLLIFTMYLYQKAAQPKFKELRKRVAEITAFLVEYFRGMEIVKVFNRIGLVRGHLKKLNTDMYRTGYSAERLNIVFYNSITMLQIFGFAVILYSGGKMILNGATSYGTLVLFINYIRQFFEPIIRLSQQFSFIEKAKASSVRIFELQKDEGNEEYKGTEDFSFENNIVFKDVCYSYDGKKGVLKNVNLEIKKGKKTAFVGRTGGGKTTVIKLMLKLLSPDSGSIEVDGKDIGTIRQETLRDKIGYVSQNIFLFSGTLMDNFKMFDSSISDEEVFAVCRKIGIYERISSLPGGFSTKVSESGKNFSKGEQQLINIARAMIRAPEIVIMDEATSTINAKFEKRIIDAVRMMSERSTLVSIAHRITTINDADIIYLIEDGAVTASGSHDELQKKSTIYKRYNDILGGFLE